MTDVAVRNRVRASFRIAKDAWMRSIAEREDIPMSAVYRHIHNKKKIKAKKKKVIR